MKLPQNMRERLQYFEKQTTVGVMGETTAKGNKIK